MWNFWAEETIECLFLSGLFWENLEDNAENYADNGGLAFKFQRETKTIKSYCNILD